MNDKITTSVGVFTVGAWYVGDGSEVFKATSNPSRDNVAGFSIAGAPVSFFSDKINELPPELSGGKIEPVPWEPKCDGKSVYQVCDRANFKGEVILTPLKSACQCVGRNGKFQDIDGERWSYCRPVPDDQRVWGD